MDETTTNEVERLRMQLAACSTVAFANTRDGAAKAREMHPDYRCAAVDDVARAVDREMYWREKTEACRQACREELAAAEARGRAAGLREAAIAIHDLTVDLEQNPEAREWNACIDAALAVLDAMTIRSLAAAQAEVTP